MHSRFHCKSGANFLVGAQDPRTWDYFNDDRTSNDTWVSMATNAAFTASLAGLNQVSGSYQQCLQGYGVLSRDIKVCGS